MNQTLPTAGRFVIEPLPSREAILGPSQFANYFRYVASGRYVTLYLFGVSPDQATLPEVQIEANGGELGEGVRTIQVPQTPIAKVVLDLDSAQKLADLLQGAVQASRAASPQEGSP